MKNRFLFSIFIILFIVKGFTVNNLIKVEGGTFIMGDTFSTTHSDNNFLEKPEHKVTLNYDFYIGKYEVTFEEYYLFCEENGWYKPYDQNWGVKKMPVVNVWWLDVVRYCNWLSKKEGLPKAYTYEGYLLDTAGNITTDITKVAGYRMPTEAEWEYAAKGGKHSKDFRYSGSNILNEAGWYKENSNNKTHPIALKVPNELGLYDMSGNVSEWCTDSFYKYKSNTQFNPYFFKKDDPRIARGGNYLNIESFVRITARSYEIPDTEFIYIGFRIARTIMK